MPRKAATKSTRRAEPPEVNPAFAPVVAAFAGNRSVHLEKGWGAGNVVLKKNSKIFVMTSKENLVVKLPAARVQEFVDRGKGEKFDPRKDGRLMKEWLVVAKGSADWVALAQEAYEFGKKK